MLRVRLRESCSRNLMVLLCVYTFKQPRRFLACGDVGKVRYVF
jgi:hypothetical protein